MTEWWTTLSIAATVAMGLAQDVLPLGEDQVGLDAQGPALVAFGDKREEHLGFFGSLGQVNVPARPRDMASFVDGSNASSLRYHVLT